MNKEMQQILIDIFPLIVEVNFNTKYRIMWDIQPTFADHYQIWYGVFDNDNDFGHMKTVFWNRENKFKQEMAEFKNELEEILGRD